MAILEVVKKENFGIDELITYYNFNGNYYMRINQSNLCIVLPKEKGEKPNLPQLKKLEGDVKINTLSLTYYKDLSNDKLYVRNGNAGFCYIPSRLIPKIHYLDSKKFGTKYMEFFCIQTDEGKIVEFMQYDSNTLVPIKYAPRLPEFVKFDTYKDEGFIYVYMKNSSSGQYFVSINGRSPYPVKEKSNFNFFTKDNDFLYFMDLHSEKLYVSVNQNEIYPLVF